MSIVLKKRFFVGKAPDIAPKLLGKFLCVTGQNVRSSASNICFMITEVEAYDGFRDMASHASRGRTARNYPMFGEGGRWYVYFTYGMHWMLNIVTGPKDYPSAILIRAVRSPTFYKLVKSRTSLNGPAKLTKFLKIDEKFNNKPASKSRGLWIEDGGVRIKSSRIKKSPRVGVAYAGPYWAKKKWRFLLKFENG